MSAFRFVASEFIPAEADARFWRDVEVADRLTSPGASSFFLRELCHAKAIDDVGRARDPSDLEAVRARETQLIRSVRDRGYAVASVS